MQRRNLRTLICHHLQQSVVLAFLLLSPALLWSQTAFIPNSDDNSVTVIDAEQNSIVKTIENVGTTPTMVAVSDDGNRAFIGNTGSNSVAVINTENNEVLAIVPLSGTPTSMVYVPDASEPSLDVAVEGGQVGLNILDVNTNQLSVVQGSPWGGVAMAVHPDRSKVYGVIPGDPTSRVSVISVSSGQEEGSIEVGKDARFIAIDRNGDFAYVSNTGDGTVSKINLSSGMVESTFNIGINTGPLVLSQDERQLYVVESFIQEVVIFDLDVEGAGNNLSIGGDITGLANVTIGDREELFIVNASGNDVLVFDVVDEIQKDAIFVGNVPTAFGSFMSPHHQPPPPEVRFDYTVVGFEVHFNDRTQGEEASRTWRFGNGNQSDEMNPTELYAEAGTYVVTLTVTFESGAVNSYTRDILVQELPDARHLSVSVAKNSEDNHIDVMGKFGYNPTDHLISYTASGTTGAFRGTARAGMDSIIYTPNADYVGPDVVQYDICLRSNPDECETAYLYINVFDGNCAYVMNASSNWHHCPEACDNGGSSFPYGQPTPGQCWAYNFFFENTSNDPITLLDATLYVDDHMRIVEGSGTVDRDRSDVVPNVTVSFDEKNHRVKFSLPPGEVIEPHAIYSFYFRVDVLELPVNGRGTEYHSYMEGIAGCARGLGNLVNVPLDEAEGSACDPNEITVSPEGCGDGNAIDREVKTLTYTIEFENEGNGPATDVTVRDVLPDGLDLSTVHVVDGAPFMPQMTHNPFIDANELNFNFRNINLPPASEDSLGSRGFVKFTVDIEDGLPDGTEIRNSASIFFDAQIPVRTDTTLTTVETAPAPISNLKADTTLLNGDFPCYPLNPAPTGGSGNYKYQWNVGFRVPQLTLCPFATGYIEVVITDTETGCQTADRHNYTFVDSLISSTVEPTLAKPMQVVVAPNPFREFTDIQLSGEENAEIVLEVFNSVGQRVRELYRGPILSGETRNFRFEGDGLSNGMYYYRLQSREGLRQTGKMVLLR